MNTIMFIVYENEIKRLVKASLQSMFTGLFQRFVKRLDKASLLFSLQLQMILQFVIESVAFMVFVRFRRCLIPWFLFYFHVILKCNHSNLFALRVYVISKL